MDKLSSSNVYAFLANGAALAGGSVCFDLEGIQFISPGALVPLAAEIHNLASNGQRVQILLKNPRLRSYLVRCGFCSTIEEFASFEPIILPTKLGDFEIYKNSNPLLLEVSRLQSGRDLPGILGRLVSMLRFRLNYEKAAAYDTAVAISEVSQNTFDHSKSQCGYIAVQAFGEPPNRFVEIGVADFGCGLLKSLRQNPKNSQLSQDLEAIECATVLGTSEFDDPTRGTGLHHLLEIARKYNGTVQIGSGSAVVRHRMDTARTRRFNVGFITGVHIMVSLPNKSQN
jgi:hypothetical protein